MPEKHFDVVNYYENGTRDQQDKHKLWSKLLDKMYDGNLIFGEHHGGGDCEAGLRRGERSRPR